MNQPVDLIDHAVLKPTSGLEENEAGCRVALKYQVASICVLPSWVEFCSERLKGSSVKTGTVISFPHGSAMPAVKMKEAEVAIKNGARELDVVVNISKVLSRDWGWVESEIEELTGFAHAGEALIKMIFENCYLGVEEKVRLCRICSGAGVDFIKTSTGFGPGGATDDDVRLMVETVSGSVKVKASGGIRNLDRLLQFKALGAARIGTSSTVAILEEYYSRMESER